MSKLARRLRKVELISKIFVSRILGGGGMDMFVHVVRKIFHIISPMEPEIYE